MLKQDKFKRLLEARRTGTIAAADDDDAAIYDEVDEDTFRQHKRVQLMNDDFIVDDNGEGYVDTGADEWDAAGRPEYSLDDEPAPRKTRPAKKVAKTAAILNFFAPDRPEPREPKRELRPAVESADIDDILDSFAPAAKRPKPARAAPKKQAVLRFGFLTAVRAPKRPKPSLAAQAKEEPLLEPEDSELPLVGETSPVAASPEPTLKAEPTKAEPKTPEAESDSEDEVVVRRRPQAGAAPKAAVSMSAVKATEIPPTAYSAIAHTEKLPSAEVGDDNTFRMFWLDYAEADHSLLLFGKVVTKTGACVSAVVQVTNMHRELYALPRQFRKVDGADTDTPVSVRDVHEEIAPILINSYGLDMLRAKPQRMKYAFELPGVPKDAEYLKILLPYKTARNKGVVMPAEVEGETFSRIFGTNSNIFESFVLQRNVMGPCWLDITGADFAALNNATHCAVEVSVPSAACVTPVPNCPLPPPDLTCVAVAVQTTLNPKTNRQEVACISMATFTDVSQDSPVGNKPAQDLVTLVRPVGGVFPPGLRQAAEKLQLSVRSLPNEALMLGCFAAMVKQIDPDMYIGHRLENISLDVLVHRMHDLKVATWLALGRRNRKAWPDRFGKGAFNHLAVREIFQGRLLCDIANELGQSLTAKCQLWDLPEMYSVVCHQQHTSPEINFQNPRYAEDASFLLMPLKENVAQVKMAAEIAFELQILSLSKQLTNLAGNAWAHTLLGTRAGRNEYILLHEFQRNNYIVPDKEDKYHKNTSHQQEAKLEAADDDATTVTSNKKPKYQGGLVFDPEKGLHKNYILVMDFNSLYPSIIQEFNICFTTVLRDAYNISHDEERDLPAIPDRDSEAGVLPRLLNTLVLRRREVKKLLKSPSISASERAQYDIKQQALKLTANSMYGCLGYVNSRFYAKPLAMLVTNKGREILMDTRQLAELIGLRVVYGDTDSVMIDTGAATLADALKIGEDFKVQVNERYKLLEIDTDNVFKRLLLHAKKKYAAMSVTVKNGVEVAELEVKGLDMRRREYCPLLKEISTYVLRTLLSDKDPEEALTEVYGYLEAMQTKMKEGLFPVERYLINTRLSKDPNNYPNGKTMPPVQVALRLRKQGRVIKAGSVVTFVIGAPGSGDDKNPADRARAIQEALTDKLFVPDYDYYLEKQIYAPVERIVEKIEGVDMMRVATSLAIDTRKYAMRLRSAEDDLAPMELKILDVERFRQASYLVLSCKCGHQFRFGGILPSPDYKITFNGVACGKCDLPFPVAKVAAQVEGEIRRHLALYYAGWLVCDDAACGIATRQISVYGKRCIGALGKAHGCKGVMRYRYSDKMLYNQLLYFDAVFDVEKAKDKKLRPIDEAGTQMSDGQVKALAEQNRLHFALCRDVVGRYLNDCGRRYVNMKAIFDFM